MQTFNTFSLLRRHPWSLFLLTLFIGPSARAGDIAIQACCSSRELAFARYVGSQVQSDPFAKAGPVGIVIEASLPELYKSAAVVAVRKPGDNERGGLDVLQMAGDGTVAEEVISRYFAFRQQIEDLPLSSVAITPANYKFHFAGEVQTGGTPAYIYDIAPKKNRPGLLQGQLWVDSSSGHEVVLTGYLSDVPAAAGRVNLVRDTKQLNESTYVRVTHVNFAVPRLGRAEMVITEVPLKPEMMSQQMSQQMLQQPE